MKNKDVTSTFYPLPFNIHRIRCYSFTAEGKFPPPSLILAGMEIQGKWTRDEEGFMEFETPELQRHYEAITDKYHQVYNRYAAELDEDEAYYKALDEGYEMVTDYKSINGNEEFATTYITPAYVADIWYETDEFNQKRVYDRGFIRISSK